MTWRGLRLVELARGAWYAALMHTDKDHRYFVVNLHAADHPIYAGPYEDFRAADAVRKGLKGAAKLAVQRRHADGRELEPTDEMRAAAAEMGHGGGGMGPTLQDEQGEDEARELRAVAESLLPLSFDPDGLRTDRAGRVIVMRGRELLFDGQARDPESFAAGVRLAQKIHDAYGRISTPRE